MNRVLKNSLCSLFLCLCFFSNSAMASKYHISGTMGFPVLKSDLGGGFTPDLNAKAYIDIEIARIIGNLPLSLGVFFQGFLLSDYGRLPVSNNGLMFVYYPFGMPISTVNQGLAESGEISTQRISPYVKLKTGLTFVNLRETGGSEIQIGASGIGYQVSAGVDFPLFWGISLGPQFGYMTTLFLKDYRDNTISIYGYQIGATATIRLD